MDEVRVIQRCKAGDREAFGQLVRQYQAEAIGHALAILHRREDALDAVQDAFIRAFRGMDRLEPDRPFYPWFYIILRNHCYSMLRKRRSGPATGLDECRLLASHPSVSDREQTDLLETALQGLSAEDRELITLKHLDGLGYDQLAHRLSIPPGTVMSRLYHARRRLREHVRRLQKDTNNGKNQDD